MTKNTDLNTQNSNSMAKKQEFKVYELDFGDTNLLSENMNEILEWIRSDMDDMRTHDVLEYKISIRLMTREQINKIPEWS